MGNSLIIKVDVKPRHGSIKKGPFVLSSLLFRVDFGVQHEKWSQTGFFFLVFFLDIHQILTHVHMYSHKPTIRMMPAHSQNKYLEDVEFLHVS